MARPPTSSFRFPVELLDRIDEFAIHLEQETGVPVSRNAAAAKLLTDALDAAESRKRKRKR